MPVRSATAIQISGTSTPSRSSVTTVCCCSPVIGPSWPMAGAPPAPGGRRPRQPSGSVVVFLAALVLLLVLVVLLGLATGGEPGERQGGDGHERGSTAQSAGGHEDLR